MAWSAAFDTAAAISYSQAEGIPCSLFREWEMQKVNRSLLIRQVEHAELIPAQHGIGLDAPGQHGRCIDGGAVVVAHEYDRFFTIWANSTIISPVLPVVETR